MICKECGSHRVVERPGNSKYLTYAYGRDKSHMDYLQCPDCRIEYPIRNRKIEKNLKLSTKENQDASYN